MLCTPFNTRGRQESLQPLKTHNILNYKIWNWEFILCFDPHHYSKSRAHHNPHAYNANNFLIQQSAQLRKALIRVINSTKIICVPNWSKSRDHL